jgi:hypothetical protein
LAREPGVKVYVLCPSRENLRFIRSYDAERSLRLRWLFTPTRRPDSLFRVPRRDDVLRRWGWYIGRFPVLVTTESTSTRLKDKPNFTSKMIRLRHGAGDGERIFDPRICQFDLILMPGTKDKQRLIEVGHVTEENSVVVGYAKFELIRPREVLFARQKALALYNPHSNPDHSSWHSMGDALIDVMRSMQSWNFVVAPHVKTKSGPSSGMLAANVLCDRGSCRSIDMTYTQAADVYIGDVSSQLYEFLHTGPRPCVFINAHRIVGWEEDDRYANWRLGQVIGSPEELPAALDRAQRLQEHYAPLQRTALQWSVDDSAEPASERQARAIIEFLRRTRSG